MNVWRAAARRGLCVARCMSISGGDLPERHGDDLASRLLAGERRALAQSLTLVESTNLAHGPAATRLMSHVLTALRDKPVASTFRVGVSGPPGAGKSCFIDRLGMHLVEQGHRVAVITVDPSSVVSGGSVLGDKTRMESLSRAEGAFVRPSPSRGFLGGVTANTFEGILLCEASGYDVVLLETVGVGQSEVAVAALTDCFLLLIPPAGGDELQGIKKGIMEVSDFVCITKADGDLSQAAGRAHAQYKAASKLLFRGTGHPWPTEVLKCSSRVAGSVESVWQALCGYKELMNEGGHLEARRIEQRRQQLWAQVTAEVLHRVKHNPQLRDVWPRHEGDVLAGRVTPRVACGLVLDAVLPVVE